MMQFSHNIKGMVYCNKCHMAVHVLVPNISISQVTGVKNLTCFDIVHIKDMEIFCNQWELN